MRKSGASSNRQCLGFPDPTVTEFSSLGKALQQAWDARPHKSSGWEGQYDSALYVCEKPRGSQGTSNARKYNIFEDGESGVFSGINEDEMADIFGEGARCDSSKDRTSAQLRTAGVVVLCE